MAPQAGLGVVGAVHLDFGARAVERHTGPGAPARGWGAAGLTLGNHPPPALTSHRAHSLDKPRQGGERPTRAKVSQTSGFFKTERTFYYMKFFLRNPTM